MRKVLILGLANSIHLEKWTKPLASHFEVHVVTLHPPRFGQDAWLKGMHLHVIPRPTKTRLDFLLAIPKLQKLYRLIQPDLIHAHYLSSYGILGAQIKTSVPKLVSVWGSDLLIRSGNPFFRIVMQKALDQYDWVNLAAPHMLDVFRSRFDFNRPVEVFQYGIDLEKFSLVSPAEKDQRPFRVLSFRDWKPIYNIDKIIEAFGRFCLHHPHSELHILGTGSAQEKELLMKVAADRKNIFFHGRVEQHEILSFLRKAHCFLSVPSSDGLPLSVLEGLATGCYPILSDLPSNRMWQLPQMHFVQQLEVDSLVQAMQEAHSGWSNYDSSSHIARIASETNYAKNTERLLAAYRIFLNQTPSPATTKLLFNHLK